MLRFFHVRADACMVEDESIIYNNTAVLQKVEQKDTRTSELPNHPLSHQGKPQATFVEWQVGASGCATTQRSIPQPIRISPPPSRRFTSSASSI